jgi:hypothetical protein
VGEDGEGLALAKDAMRVMAGRDEQ